MKLVVIISLVVFTCLCCESKKKLDVLSRDYQSDSAARSVENQIWESLGEPSGLQIGYYDFYMCIGHFRAFEKYHLFSFRKSGTKFWNQEKVTSVLNIKKLANEFDNGIPADYQSYYMQSSASELDTIRAWIDKFNIDLISKSNEKPRGIIDGQYYELLIFDRGKITSINKAFGNEDDLGPDLKAFFENVRNRYYRFKPNNVNH
jgi:hypothetical protein